MVIESVVCSLGWEPRASCMLSKCSPIEHYLIPECIILKIIRTFSFMETKRCHGKPLIYPLPQWSRGTEQTHRWPHRWSVAKREGGAQAGGFNKNQLWVWPLWAETHPLRGKHFTSQPVYTQQSWALDRRWMSNSWCKVQRRRWKRMLRDREWRAVKGCDECRAEGASQKCKSEMLKSLQLVLASCCWQIKFINDF